jgi:hypothetical protein
MPFSGFLTEPERPVCFVRWERRKEGIKKERKEKKRESKKKERELKQGASEINK